MSINAKYPFKGKISAITTRSVRDLGLLELGTVALALIKGDGRVAGEAIKVVW